MLLRKSSRLFAFARHFRDYSVVSVAIRCKFCVKGNRLAGNGQVQNWEIQPNLMPQGLLKMLPSLNFKFCVNLRFLYKKPVVTGFFN